MQHYKKYLSTDQQFSAFTNTVYQMFKSASGPNSCHQPKSPLVNCFINDCLPHYVWQLSGKCNSNCNWGTCIAPPTRRPKAHHRVNPYLGARRQNETARYSDHDERICRSQQFQMLPQLPDILHWLLRPAPVALPRLCNPQV